MICTGAFGFVACVVARINSLGLGTKAQNLKTLSGCGLSKAQALKQTGFAPGAGGRILGFQVWPTTVLHSRFNIRTHTAVMKPKHSTVL